MDEKEKNAASRESENAVAEKEHTRSIFGQDEAPGDQEQHRSDYDRDPGI
jgi:hypothetical protein